MTLCVDLAQIRFVGMPDEVGVAVAGVALGLVRLGAGGLISYRCGYPNCTVGPRLSGGADGESANGKRDGA